MAYHPRGMLTVDELSARVASGQIETVLAVFPDLYGRLMGKRFAAGFFLEHTAQHGFHVCDYLLTVDMEMEVVAGYAFANWEGGYGDLHCVPDWSTLRQITWLEKTALVFCDVERGGQPIALAPRTLLKTQLERLQQAGFQAMAGTELEYYLFKDSYEQAKAKGYENLETSGWYLEDYNLLPGTREEPLHAAARRHLEQSGIPVESSKGEWGPGQHELNLRYAHALEMSDRHALYKHGLKEMAHQQGLAVSFMAKWRADLAGSGMHLHLSLWDQAGERNLFAGDEALGPLRVSPVFRHFLGGWLAHARAIAPFCAPYPNSYKRYVYQSWAPTTIAWSLDNRTAGFRVVGQGASLRIESRLPGADANPYLAIAASLAAGLDGIHKQTEPPAPFAGDAYQAAELPRVPANLPEAVAEMEQSAMLREAFGAEAIAHYAHFFRTEQRKYDGVVTSWERQRYFERG